ncbi:MAG: redox-regulated ATPase YchF [Candidatus Kapaibacterium sp.]
MQIGIVGLPFSGKTTLFRTLAQIHLDETSSGGKKETNQAVVKVPDKRLDKLTDMFNPKKKVNATIEIVDLVSVQKGDNTTSQFNTQFIARVRNNDALLHIVRGFRDEAVPHVDGTIDMMRDIRTLEDELIFSDLQFLENRFDKLEKDMKKPKAKDAAIKEMEVMKKWNEALSNEIPLREVEMSEDEMKYIKNYQPLTAKPMLIALNLDEEDVKKADTIVRELREKVKGKNISIEPFFAKIEMELSQLNDEEKQVFMDEYGLTDSPLDRMIFSAYELLGLQSFFTVGEDENRAWTIKKGMNAQESAGAIHTDFYNKFIRAEVVAYEDLINAGSLAACRDKGLLRLEGKEYIVKDGDILNIRHG